MDSKKIGELREHLQAAMACLDGDYSEDEGNEKAEDAMVGTDDQDDDTAANSLKMKMGKYK